MLRVTTWILLLAGVAWAQTMPGAQSGSTASPGNTDHCGADEKCRAAARLVAREFGPTFKLDPAFPVLTADLDGDGAEDVILVATAKEIMVGQVEFHYRVIDPYNSYFGFGDPKVTTQFTIQDGPQALLLIVHNWRAGTPKAKFVVINLSFKTVSLARRLIKKKVVTAISADEVTGMSSSVYWTGRQYKWEPGKME